MDPTGFEPVASCWFGFGHIFAQTMQSRRSTELIYRPMYSDAANKISDINFCQHQLGIGPIFEYHNWFLRKLGRIAKLAIESI